MKKLTCLLTMLFVLTLADFAAADGITVTGDARLRPRLDLQDKTETTDIETQTKTTDGYYYYRARLNVKGELGDGWFGHVQLGSDGLAYWTGKFGEGDTPSGSSISTAGRGSVDFMLIYFGRKTEKFGYYGGVIPVNGLTNPLLDLHYYSDKMIDVPFFLFSNNGSHGFSGYVGFKGGHKVNATIMVDSNEKKTEVDVDSLGTGANYNTENDLKDRYTVMLDAPLKLSNFMVQPVVFFTAVKNDGEEAPVTFGLNVTTPKFGKTTFSGTFGLSDQSADSTTQYSAWYGRFKCVSKVGTGTLTAWVDLAEKKFDADDDKYKFLYWWVSYTIPVYKSDNGSVSVKPTWRHISEKREDVDGNEFYKFTREKIELTIDISFK